MSFSTDAAERMRIDSSGNVGIGTSSPSQKLQVNGNIVSVGGRVIANTSSTGTVNLLEFSQGGTRGAGNNWGMYWSDSTGETNAALWASYTGGNNAAALVFGTNAGVGGSSGIASTTERMRISSGGNVGIGTSNPTGKLQIDLGNLSTFGNLSNSGLNITGSSGSVGNIYQIGFGYATGATNAPAAIYALTTSSAGFNNNAICFATRSVTTDTAPTERMRILSGGSVCVNTTAAVVDSTSRLIVETTTANGVAAEFTNNTSGTCSVAINNSGAATSTLINWIAAGSYRAAVTWNGTNIIYGTPSDQRLKENIVDSSSALISINNIKIRSFDFKENGNHVKFGVIAQELESIFPEAVLKGIDNEDGSIKESWSVDTSTLVPMLVKAIQEQQALIENLTTRLNALEGN
jgi:hypothetical protein